MVVLAMPNVALRQTTDVVNMTACAVVTVFLVHLILFVLLVLTPGVVEEVCWYALLVQSMVVNQAVEILHQVSQCLESMITEIEMLVAGVVCSMLIVVELYLLGYYELALVAASCMLLVPESLVPE